MKKLRDVSASELHAKNQGCYASLRKLLDELEKRELPADMERRIDQLIETINDANLSEKKSRKQIQSAKNSIIKSLEKQLKIVPKNYYRNLWMVLGMSAFGVPLGVAFGVALDNMAFIGIGLPIGMSIGLAVGGGMDEKAKKEDRQLNFEVSI